MGRSFRGSTEGFSLSGMAVLHPLTVTHPSLADPLIPLGLQLAHQPKTRRRTLHRIAAGRNDPNAHSLNGTIYSLRSDSTGLTCVARNAGNHDAANPVPKTTMAARPNVIGSAG